MADLVWIAEDGSLVSSAAHATVDQGVAGPDSWPTHLTQPVTINDVATNTAQQATQALINQLIAQLAASIKVDQGSAGAAPWPVDITGGTINVANQVALSYDASIEDLNQNLQTAAYSKTVNFAVDSTIEEIELEFTTREPRDITLTVTSINDPTGRVVWKSIGNTSLLVQNTKKYAINDGSSAILTISQTTNACSVDVTMISSVGASTLAGAAQISAKAPDGSVVQVPLGGYDPNNSWRFLSDFPTTAPYRLQGTWRRNSGYESGYVWAISDVPLTTCQIEYSNDGVNVDTSIVAASVLPEQVFLAADYPTLPTDLYIYVEVIQPFTLPYHRYVIEAASAPTTFFAAASIMMDEPFTGSFQALNATLSNLSTALLTRSVIAGYTPTGGFTNGQMTSDGNLQIASGQKVDANNTKSLTAADCSPGSPWIGAWTQTRSQAFVRELVVLASNDATVGGTFTFEFGENDGLGGVTTTISEPRTIHSFTTVRDFDLINAGEWFRCKFEPALALGAATVFISTTLRRLNDGYFARLANQELEEDNATMGTSFSFLKAWGPTGLSKNVRATTDGGLHISMQEVGDRLRYKQINAKRAVSGQAITAHRKKNIDLPFHKAGTINAVTGTQISGAGGSVAINAATLYVQLGTTAGAAEYRVRSIDINDYEPGEQLEFEWTQLFGGTLDATTYAYVGPWDGSDGFRIGWNGTDTVIEHWKGGALIESAKLGANLAASQWEYPATADNPDSLFRRDGAVEAFSLTNPNIMNMFWEHLGIKPHITQTASPDDDDVVLHRFKFPNVGPFPSTNNPDLPITWVVGRTSGSANITIRTGSAWGATTGSTEGRRLSQTPNRLHFHAEADALMQSSTTGAKTFKTVTSGYKLYMTNYTLIVANSGNAYGKVYLRDGPGGAIKALMPVPAKQGSGPDVVVPISLTMEQEPMEFSTSLYLDIVDAGTGITASCTVGGYEEVQ